VEIPRKLKDNYKDKNTQLVRMGPRGRGSPGIDIIEAHPGNYIQEYPNV